MNLLVWHADEARATFPAAHDTSRSGYASPSPLPCPSPTPAPAVSPGPPLTS